jgi:small subunit ribosomal protein S1
MSEPGSTPEPPTPDQSKPEPGSPVDPDATSSPEDFGKALQEFEQQPAAQAKTPAKGEVTAGARVKATVVSVGEDVTMVDFGGRSEGSVETKHFRAEDGKLKVGVGDVIDLFVVEAGDQVILAPSVRPAARGALRQIREALTSGTPVTGRVTGVNAGGISVDVGGVRGFCPISQIEAGFCSDASTYVGKTLEFLVTKVESGRGGAVLSRRQLLRRAEQENAKRLLATLKPGDEREGTVARLEAFGVFVDLGGVDGLVHVSELRHGHTGHPREAVKPGEKLRVKVLKIEPGKDGQPRIALSVKAAQPDPWVGIEGRFARGARVTGSVVRLTDFGAFVNLEPGVDGLVHVSEVAPHRVNHVKEVLSVGQTIETMVLGVDPEKRRISLSIKATQPAAAPAAGGVEAMESEGVGGRRGGRRPDREGRGDRGDRGGRGDRDRGSRGGRGGRPGRGDRERDPASAEMSERSDRERESRGDRGDRPDRGERYITSTPRREEPEMTTMAIALRKAMERARREGRDS